MFLKNILSNITISKKQLNRDLDEALAVATELAEELDRTKRELIKLTRPSSKTAATKTTAKKKSK
jgi:hypothetical protein